MGFTMKKIIVDDVRLLVDFVADKLTISKREAKRLVDARGVFVNGKRVWMGKHQLMIGDKVEIVGAPSAEQSTDINQATELSILYSGGDALVIDKPAGIECVNGKNHIESQLRIKWPQARVVHRLDRDTSGCLLATTSEAAWDFFIEQFKSHTIKKRYLALLSGTLKHKRVVVDSALDGKSAKSIFHIRAKSNDFTLCEIELLTGRTHQIRRHAMELNCAVLGDRKYGDQSMTKDLRAVPRQMLHAWKVSFVPGLEFKVIEIEAPVPDDFASWQRRLRL